MRSIEDGEARERGAPHGEIVTLVIREAQSESRERPRPSILSQDEVERMRDAVAPRARDRLIIDLLYTVVDPRVALK